MDGTERREYIIVVIIVFRKNIRANNFTASSNLFISCFMILNGQIRNCFSAWHNVLIFFLQSNYLES